MIMNFDIVSKDAEIDVCYGLEAFYITKEDISALLSGRKLYSTVNCGEYAITIEMAEAILKADYEKHLKDNMVAMLEEFDLRLSEYEDADLIRVDYIRQDIQEKINILNAESEEK